MESLIALVVATLLMVVLPVVVMMLYYRVSQGVWLWHDGPGGSS